MPPARQYALNFPQDTRYAPEDFLPGAANEEALAWIADPALWPGGRLAIHGEAGVGKTHLLHVFAARRGGIVLPAQDLRAVPSLPAGAGPIAWDDADMAPSAEALLHALNAASDAGRPVLLSGVAPPSAWMFTLPDLTSRLRAITPVALRAPEDGLLRALLAQSLNERQLVVPESLQDWLLARLPRTGAAMRDAAARLDRLSLAAGGRVTRGMLALLLDAGDDERDEKAPEEHAPCPPGTPLFL